MKGKFLTWEEFKEQDPKQTAVEVTYTSKTYKPLQVPFTRIYLGEFQSREEAWEWCKRVNAKRKIIYEKGEPVEIGVRLIRLAKLVREYTESKPKRISGIQLA